ncbi:MATE family efflux transporter [Candidatus Micrarchaeota archaeon]|nr:MATE family efflux transporter [Candidatus Micrarchaeota archaeon]MBU2477176.1 MATE family efflux transporter [Candidatus Micrarchaeota archaeon]
MDKKRDLTQGSILRNLIFLALPIMFGMLLQTAFNVIDTIFIGMLGANALAAVSITFPVVFIFIAFASGLGIGSTTLVAQAIGRKDLKKADNVAEHSLLLAVVTGIIIAVLGIIFGKYVFVFMGATPEILKLTLAYSDTIFVGFIFLFIGFISQGILQAEGNSKTPMINMIISVIINIILDPIMIFGLFGFPALGIFGGALATVIARSIGAGLNIYYILKGKGIIKIKPRDFSFNTKIFKDIVFLGAPASAGQLTISIGLTMVMSFVGVFGVHAIAAYGVGTRLDSLAILPILGLTSASIAIVGQNIGAKKIERAKKTIFYSTAISSVLMAFVAVIFILFPKPFFDLFSSNEEVLSIGIAYLSISAFAYPFRGILMSIAAGFQGAGKTFLAMITTGIYWILIVLLAFFLKESFGIKGIWYSILISAVLGSAITLIVYKTGIWIPKELKEIPA